MNRTAGAAAFDIAVAAYGRGDVQAARVAAQDTLAEAPDHAGALYMLGALDLDAGDAEAALPRLETAAKLEPRHAGICRSLGLTYQALGRHGEAIPALQAAISGGESSAATHNALGLALFESGDAEGAVRAFKQALALDPRDAGAYNNLAVALNRLHDFNAAAEAYRKSLDIDPRNTGIRINLANLYEQMNELEEAQAEVARGLAIEPAAPGLLLVAARCERRLGALGEAVARLEPLSKDQGVPLLVRRGVEFELGRDYDALQDSARAFTHFSAGNLIASELWPDMVAGAASYREELDRMLACYTEGALSALPASPPGRKAPVFLVSFPRSGTTLMDTILDAHPDVTVMEEEPPLHYVVETLRQSHRGFPGGVLELTEPELAELRSIYWKETEKVTGPLGPDSLLVDKNPFYSTQAPLIQRLFPEARYVFALRHPCAVILSCFMQPFGRNPALANFLDLETTAVTYDRVMRLWLRYRTALRLQVHELRYESLVADKEREVRAVSDFLGLPWDKSILDHTVQAKKRGRIYTPSYHQVVRPIYKDAVDRWRAYEGNFGRAMELLRPYITTFGYET